MAKESKMSLRRIAEVREVQSIEEVVISCHACNAQKNCRTPEEWLAGDDCRWSRL
jgi:hypothetical protein